MRTVTDSAAIKAEKYDNLLKKYQNLMVENKLYRTQNEEYSNDAISMKTTIKMYQKFFTKFKKRDEMLRLNEEWNHHSYPSK